MLMFNVDTLPKWWATLAGDRLGIRITQFVETTSTASSPATGPSHHGDIRILPSLRQENMIFTGFLLPALELVMPR